MRESAVTIPSGEYLLAASLATPPGDGPFPTALLLAGSGELDRDANHKKIRLNLSRDLAANLAEAGWASLRFDKRGVGASTGDYLSTGFFDERSDAEATLAWLRGQPETDVVVAVGHSAGSLMAAELAGREPGVEGAVLLATSAKTGEDALRWQTQQISDHVVPGFAKTFLKLFRTSVVKQQGKAVAKLKATTGDTARIQFVKVNAKWMREFIAYDPVPALQRTKVPLLAVTGSKDIQVDPADLAVVAAVAAHAETIELDDVDHILRTETAAHSNPRKYAKQAKQPIDPRVLDAVLSWLNEHWPSVAAER